MDPQQSNESSATPRPWWYNKERKAIEARPDNHNIETPAYQVLNEADGELICKAVKFYDENQATIEKQKIENEILNDQLEIDQATRKACPSCGLLWPEHDVRCGLWVSRLFSEKQKKVIKDLVKALRYCAVDPGLLQPANNRQNAAAMNALADVPEELL